MALVQNAETQKKNQKKEERGKIINHFQSCKRNSWAATVVVSAIQSSFVPTAASAPWPRRLPRYFCWRMGMVDEPHNEPVILFLVAMHTADLSCMELCFHLTCPHPEGHNLDGNFVTTLALYSFPVEESETCPQYYSIQCIYYVTIAWAKRTVIRTDLRCCLYVRHVRPFYTISVASCYCSTWQFASPLHPTTFLVRLVRFKKAQGMEIVNQERG